MKETATKKIVRLAIFLAVGIVLSIVESMFPLPIAIPGIRLGLANTMGLIVLYYYSPKEYLAIGFLRVFMVGLLRSGLGSVTFVFSLAGWLVSSIFALLVYMFHKASVYGLSIVSAMFHTVGQIIMVIIYYENIIFINYLPVLLITGAISGGLVALISSYTIVILNRIFKVKEA